MTDEHEQRLQFLIECYTARFGEQYYDYDKVEEELYKLIGDIEANVRSESNGPHQHV